MKLTSDHSSVRASFDRPLSYRKVSESTTHSRLYIEYEFQVGFFTYAVEFLGDREDLEVTFTITGITGSDEEFREYISKMRREEVALEDVPAIKEEILEYPEEDWAVGNAMAVFATVWQLVEEVAIKHDVRCISFSGTSEKKTRIYEKMVRSRFKGWQVNLIPGIGGHTFELCRG